MRTPVTNPRVGTGQGVKRREEAGTGGGSPLTFRPLGRGRGRRSAPSPPG